MRREKNGWWKNGNRFCAGQEINLKESWEYGIVISLIDYEFIWELFSYIRYNAVNIFQKSAVIGAEGLELVLGLCRE